MRERVREGETRSKGERPEEGRLLLMTIKYIGLRIIHEFMVMIS